MADGSPPAVVKVIEELQEELERTFIAPEREKAVGCIERCEAKGGNAAVQSSCARRCQETLQTLHEVFHMHWGPFAGELGSCIEGCYTETMRSAPPKGTPADEALLQARYSACCSSCGDKLESLVPKVREAIIRDMRQASQMG